MDLGNSRPFKRFYKSSEFYYSAVIILAEEDVITLRKKLIDQLGENLKFIDSSKEQSGHALYIDLFSLKR